MCYLPATSLDPISLSSEDSYAEGPTVTHGILKYYKDVAAPRVLGSKGY